MRPRTLRRTLALVGAGGMLAAGSLTAGVARAETVTLAGSFGFEPQWSQVVDCPCREVRFSYAPTQAGIASGVREFTARINGSAAAPGGVPVDGAAGYSLGSHALVGWIRDNPLDARTRTLPVTLVGAPEAPHNPRKGNGHRNTEGLPQTGEYSNVTFVVREYDPVADAAANPNVWSRINSRMSTHIGGYDELGDPDVVWTDEATGSTTEFHRSKVLPMLRWRDWFTSDERMAELDARYRPRIDAAYERPWKDSEWDSESSAAQPDEDSATTDDNTAAGSVSRTRVPSTRTTAGTAADADTSGGASDGGDQ